MVGKVGLPPLLVLYNQVACPAKNGGKPPFPTMRLSQLDRQLCG